MPGTEDQKRTSNVHNPYSPQNTYQVQSAMMGAAIQVQVIHGTGAVQAAAEVLAVEGVVVPVGQAVHLVHRLAGSAWVGLQPTE